MAIFHGPKQRQSDLRWDYTSSSDEEGWAHPEGYCRGFEHPDDTDKVLAKLGLKLPIDERKKILLHQAKFHVDGHPSSHAAVHCYYLYLLDFEVEHYPFNNEAHKCENCKNNWSSVQTFIGDICRRWLCEKCRTPEVIEKILMSRWLL